MSHWLNALRSSNNPQNNMRKRILPKCAALLLACIGTGKAAVTVAVDMDPGTAGIQSSISVGVGAPVTVDLWMTADVAGVSSYSVSVAFDNSELTLLGAPASTELLPALFTFNFTAGVASESQALGRVNSFEAATFGAGPVSSTFRIGSISFTATAPVTNGVLDVTPGLLNAGIDGIFDNASGDLGPGAIFVGGLVNFVPEPSSRSILALSAAGLWAVRRRRPR